MLLTSLIPSFEHLVITLLYGKKTIMIDDVITTLLSNEFIKILISKKQHSKVILFRHRNMLRSKSKLYKNYDFFKKVYMCLI
uniref:Uncharacterized protein n=1 Tax=Physcomitrium patens TaxID=3218 RepID=A0A7I4F4A9_PHYPA